MIQFKSYYSDKHTDTQTHTHTQNTHTHTHTHLADCYRTAKVVCEYKKWTYATTTILPMLQYA